MFSNQKLKDDLKAEGFVQVESLEKLEGNTYMMDSHCYDLIYLPSSHLDKMETMPLIVNRSIVVQVIIWEKLN